MTDIKQHKRVNDMLLGPLERPALQWLAARMPAWVTPDVLTGIGVIAAIMIFAGYWLSSLSVWWLWFVNLGFVLNWFGDSLDGTLARFRKIERPKFGFYIDHTVDAVAEFLTIIGIGMSPFLRLDISAFALIGYLLVSVHVYVRTCVDGVFKISYGTMGPTEMRVIIMIVNTAIFFAPKFFLQELTAGMKPFDYIGVFLAIGLSAAFLIASSKEAIVLAREGK
ncbi:MAG: CDP-alcohol phosphatidyltransferase [Actinobacteria bacterium HGW-Actinobacteria-6]|jgi:phosphatidylglycerophosphate synthase|nr:MAG: CDP-alcohol phosphatidyltransferase [Actinobacteria bacterium HGW-Actinobacteria-6]